jgi:hypothetical protein
MKYKVGQILIEDRSKYIGTAHEYHCDKEFPVVRLEVLKLNYPLTGHYWMYNHTRQIHTIGCADKIDTSTDIWPEDGVILDG